MPTKAYSKTLSASWQRLEASPSPDGMATITIRTKTSGTGITISSSDTTPTVGLGANDPIFYIDVSSQVTIQANPRYLWFNAGGTAQVYVTIDW